MKTQPLEKWHQIDVLKGLNDANIRFIIEDARKHGHKLNDVYSELREIIRRYDAAPILENSVPKGFIAKQIIKKREERSTK